MASLGTLDDVAEMLEATGQYRCLRMIPLLDCYEDIEADGNMRVGIVVDVEATGPDAARDVPVEIAMIKFTYAGGSVGELVSAFHGFQEPAEPLSEHVARLTGLTTEELSGKSFDIDALNAFVGDANLLLAHNAAYDRAILENNIPGFPIRPWACTLNDIDWLDEGQFERRLGDILRVNGFFAPGHRAMVDCRSLLHILTLPLPRTARGTFATLLENARQIRAVIFAERAPYAALQILKQRRYRWSDGQVVGAPRCWWTEVPWDAAKAEVMFLRENVYGPRAAGPTMTLVNAVHRYRPIEVIASARVPAPPTPQEEDDT